MLLRQGVKVTLPNIQKQTQEGRQIEETKKYGPNERIEQKPEKELSEMEISRVQNTGYQDAQRLHWVLQQHKKDSGRNESYIK